MKKYIITALTLMLLFTACEREDPDFLGPDLNDLFGELSVLEGLDISDRNVDFQNGENTVFSAVLSKQVDWELRVTGLESGAVKSITGFSSVLDASNANWNGSTTELPLFKDEQCAVELSFPMDTLNSDADSLLLVDTLQVLSARPVEGTVIADFESGFNPGWNTFIQSGGNMSYVITDALTAAQGDRYYDMGGTVNWDWLTGLIDFPASAYDGDSFGLGIDPNDIYFNVMLNIPDTLDNTLVEFQFREDENQDGNFSSGEDLYAFQLDRDIGPGWQLISMKYEDIITLENGQPADPAGNGIHEPDKLWQISVLVLAAPNSGYSQALMDFMVFTEGGPLRP